MRFFGVHNCAIQPNTHLFHIQIHQSVDKHGRQKWADMLDVIGEGTAKDPKLPRVLKAFRGRDLTEDKIQIFNLMLVDWQISLKKEKVKDGECPWYQPSTQRKDYFTFWGMMNRTYKVKATVNDFQRFDGSVWKVMGAEIKKREKEWVSYS